MTGGRVLDKKIARGARENEDDLEKVAWGVVVGQGGGGVRGGTALVRPPPNLNISDGPIIKAWLAQRVCLGEEPIRIPEIQFQINGGWCSQKNLL